MAWPNPFRRQTPNTRKYVDLSQGICLFLTRFSCWGYTFELTEDHLSPEEAHPLKFSYDVLADECLDRLNQISPPPDKALPRNPETPSEKEQKTPAPEAAEAPRRDLYVLLRDHTHTDPKLQELWHQVNAIPEWVDWDQIARGQDVFYRYGGAALTGLAFQGLLGGMGAARVVETLARTGGFSTKVARRRLFETTQHILQCTKSLESIQPGGAGHASSVRVRLLHAAVRQRILKLAAQRPEYYSVEKYGVPINDLDSIATICTFSATLIWISFARQGIFLRTQEIADYIALWRYVAYLVGCPTQHFSSPAKAKAMFESLLLHEISPTPTSRVLANNIIRSLANQPPTYASADMLVANARWLNGNALADALDLPRPGLYYWALATGQCVFVMFMCYGYRYIPYLDRRKLAYLRRVFYAIIVESKYGLQGTETVFDFKYVPEFTTITELGESHEELGKRPAGIERRNLKALLIALLCIGLLMWCSLRIAMGLMARFWLLAQRH